MKVFNPIHRDYVAPVDLNILANTYNTLETGHKEAVASASELKKQLSILDLNNQEDAWRANKINQVQSILNANTIDDNAIGAIDDLILASEDILFGPDTMGRVKANQAWKANNAKIDAMNMPEDYKEYFKEKNPYHYEDKYDENGNIVGGTEWKPVVNPVNTVPLSDLIVKGIQIAAKEKGGGSRIQYLDANGNITTDMSKAYDGEVFNTITGTWERLTRDKIKAGIQAFIESTPGAKESLKQDWDVAEWKHQKAVAANDGNPVIDDITDAQGVVLSQADYLNKRIMPAVEAATYYNSTTSMSPGRGAATYAAAKRAGISGGAGAGYSNSSLNMRISGRNSLIEIAAGDKEAAALPSNIDVAGRYSTARNALFNNWKSLTGRNLVIPEGKRINVENLVTKYNLAPETANILRGQAAAYNSALEAQNNYYQSLDESTRKEAQFVDRFLSGQGLLSSKNGGTKMDDKIINSINNFWGTRGETAEIYLSPKTRPIFEDYINNGDKTRLKQLGITIDDNNIIHIIKGKDDGILPLLANAVSEAESRANAGFLSSVYQVVGKSRFNIKIKDANGNDANDQNDNWSRFNNNNINFGKLAGNYDSAIKTKEKLAKEHSINSDKMYLELINLQGNNFTEDYFENLYNRGIIDKQTRDAKQKYAYEAFENAVILGGDYSHASIWHQDGKFVDANFSRNKKGDNIARLVQDKKDNLVIGNLIKEAYADKRLKWSPTIIPGAKNPDGSPMYGYNLTILPRVNNKGEILGDELQLTIGNIGQEDAADMLMQDPNYRMLSNVIVAGATKGSISLTTSDITPSLGTMSIIGQGDNIFTSEFKGIPVVMNQEQAVSYGKAIEEVEATKRRIMTDGRNVTQLTEMERGTLVNACNAIAAVTEVNPNDILSVIIEDLSYGYR